MIFAKKKHQDELVCARDVKQNETYFCPGCGERVIFKQGPQKQAHFAHYKKSCHFFSEGETNSHVTGKNLIKVWAEKRHKKAEIEEYLPELKQRPDVLVTLRNSQLVIEYQCSPLSLSSFTKRTKGYKKYGYRVFWILGKRHMLNQRLTQQQAMFINFHKNIGYFLVFLDAERQCLILNYELCFENCQGIRYRTKVVNDATTLMVFIRANQRNEGLALSQSELLGQLTKLEKNCHYLNPYLKDQIDFCYRQRHYFMGFPACCLSCVRLPPIYRHADIFWRIRVVLELQKETTKLISKEALKCLFEAQQIAANVFFAMPLVSQLAIEQVNQAYLQCLLENQILSAISGTKSYRINNQIRWTEDALLKKENLRLNRAFIKKIN
ncbi:competence protein CoiA [Dellaglioa sp. BT-FLS60]